MSRLRVLYVGPGHSPIVRGRIVPFLPHVDARLVTTEPVPPDFAAAHPDLRVHVLPRPALRRLPRRLFLHTADYLLELPALVLRLRPHLVHVHYVSQLDALALLAVRRTPLVLTVMGADVLEDQVPRPWPLDGLVRRLFGRAAAVTAKSAFLAARCRALGARPERVHEVAWGVDASLFAPRDRSEARARLGLPPAQAQGGARVLLSSRALQPLYNHLAVVEAAARLDPRPHLVFTRAAEDAAHAAVVAERARALGLAATFLDALPPERMPDLYAAADAVASVPASDGLPQTVLEALACERPVVGLDLEAYRELPLAQDALARVVHRGGRPDVEALARALGAALEPRDRPGLATARRWIEEHMDLAASVARVLALYQDVTRVG